MTEKLSHQVVGYLKRTLGVDARLHRLNLRLPFFVKDSFTFFEARLPFDRADVSFTLMVERDEPYPGIVSLRKMYSMAADAVEGPVVYVCDRLKPSERKALIDNHIQFIQPDFQMFMPQVGLDLRELYRQKADVSAFKHFSPATQVVLLKWLRIGWGGSNKSKITPRFLMDGMGYSRVTRSKVINQLGEVGILVPGETDSFGPTWHFSGSEKEVYQKAKLYLRTPVKKVVGITRDIGRELHFPRAGESALAFYGELNSPAIPTYAMSASNFKALKNTRDIQESKGIDDIKAYVEIWNYDPDFPEDLAVDKVSLYLSLKDHPDERVQIELDELKRGIEWLK